MRPLGNDLFFIEKSFSGFLARTDNAKIGIRYGVSGQFQLVPRNEAKVSVFDSNFLIGDGIWEGLRVYNGRVQFCREHIDRLFQSAKAMAMNLGLPKRELNDNDVHVRLVVSRGLKSTPYQNPSVNIGLPLIVIIPEHKAAEPNAKAKGLRLVTSHIRRGYPDTKDEMWNHISKATDLQACIGANVVGADEALVLDPHGFVKTCNSTNFFIVRQGEVWAPTRAYQMQGITRQKTIDLCQSNGIPVKEVDFTVTEAYGADEAFVTGTFPSYIYVFEIDGRVIGEGKRGPVTERVSNWYQKMVQEDIQRSRETIMSKL
ncbi:hypothetical protein TMatcc_005040 [Talaromyces marneffei ATCC 18224]